MTQPAKPIGSIYTLGAFRPDRVGWELRIRAALKPIKKQPPTLKNRY